MAYHTQYTALSNRFKIPETWAARIYDLYHLSSRDVRFVTNRPKAQLTNHWSLGVGTLNMYEDGDIVYLQLVD